MPVVEMFSEAVRRLTVGELAEVEALPVVLARAAVEVLPVDGASLTLFSENLRMPLGADSALSAAAEQLQFTLGEGPCLDAYLTRRPMFYDADRIRTRWPVYDTELGASTPFRSCASTPIDLGDSLLAALDLYSESPAPWSEALVADIAQVSGQLESELQRHSTGANADAGPSWLRSRSMRKRANVWIALALAARAADPDGVDALTALRAYAYGSGTTVDELARRLADRELDIRTVLAPRDGPG